MHAILFDLDGTLVQSEKLKAQAYAIAPQRLRGLDAPDERAVEAYRQIVGSSREVASRHVMEALALEPELRRAMIEDGSATPEDALTKLRLAIYDDMVADPDVIRANEWPHTAGLLRTAREHFCATGLATMSQRVEAEHVLAALDLMRHLDVVLAKEDVRNPKPDPEIYLLAAERLDVPVEECLVLEDSVMGVRAGVAAGMSVIAVATPFTECGLSRELPVSEEWIVRDPERLVETVRRRLEKHDLLAHSHRGQS